MDYIRAGLIRGTGLSNLIGERYSAGQSITGSVGGALSDTLKAKTVGLKEYFDPLRMVRLLAGRGALGNVATAVAGKALGRSRRDIAYFGGFIRRRSTIPEMQRPSEQSATPGKTQKNSDLLEKIFYFLKFSSDQRKRSEQLARAFRQEQVNEDNRRHKQLLDAIRGFSGGKALKLEPEKEKGFFESLFGGLLDNIKNLMSNVLKSLENAVKAVLGYKVAEKIAGKFIGKDGKPGVDGKDGKKADADKKTAGKTAVKEAVEKSASKGGVKSLLKKIPLVGLGFGLMFGAARAMEGDNAGAAAELASGAVGAIPGVGAPISAAADIGLFARDVYKDLYGVFPEDDDPQSREERKKEIIQEIEERIKKFSPSSGETNLGATDALSQGIEGTGSATPYTETEPTKVTPKPTTTATRVPFTESTAGAGRGVMAGPTAADMQNAPVPAPTPVPVPKLVSDIAPLPELSMMMPSTMGESTIQARTQTNIIGGNRDRVLATSTPKQRNTDLNRFLSNSSVAV